jgi:uncharacterized protein
MLDPFIEIQARLAAHVDTRFKRFLYDQIDWQTRLFALIGPRGVGKTTMLLQRYVEAYDDPAECLYLSADHIQVQGQGLYEIAGAFFRGGGELLLIDEVHRYERWAAEIKSLYDAYPRARIGLAGSSTLDILKGGTDLSRRMVVYRLPGMSFREYLTLETGARFAPTDLTTLLAEHTKLAADALTRSGGTIIDHFHRYLDHGVYPFYVEGVDLFHVKLCNVMEKVLSEDIPSVLGVRPSAIPVLRRLIHLIASSQPFSPNIERIATALGISRETVYHYLEHLQRAGLFALIPAPGRGLKAARKPAKVYLDNPNLFPAVLGSAGMRAHIGAVREAFFQSQVRTSQLLTTDPKVDFRAGDGPRFEIGGRSKGSGQLDGDEDAWLALDDLEVGSDRRVPLWLFGFLY